MSPELMRRMKLLFAALYNPVEGERNSAAGLFYRFLIDNHVHPDDVNLLVDNHLIENMEKQFDRLSRENAYLRQQLPLDILYHAQAAGEVDPTPWTELYDRMVALWGDPLPVGWRSKVATLVETPIRIVKQWEIGLLEVPAEVIQKVNQPTNQPPPAQPKRRSTPRRRRLTANQMSVLRALDGNDYTVRGLSLHLYGELDSNEVLADTISNMFRRNWVSRRPVAGHREMKARWLYTLTEDGRQMLNENKLD